MADRTRADVPDRSSSLIPPLSPSVTRRPARRGRSCRSRCSGTGCRPASSASSSSVGFGFASSSALAATMKPGVQMPHCSAACSRNFCCRGCSCSPFAMPSIVVIVRSSASARARDTTARAARSRSPSRRRSRPSRSLPWCRSIRPVAQRVEQGFARLAEKLRGLAVDRRLDMYLGHVSCLCARAAARWRPHVW